MYRKWKELIKANLPIRWRAEDYSRIKFIHFDVRNEMCTIHAKLC